MASVSLKSIAKAYHGETAVNNFDLEVADGELVVLTGPSGCGKSSVLRMIAGLEEITEGELYIDGVLSNSIPPKDRDIAMMFQNFSLIRNKTVFENLAYGLRLRGLPSAEIDARIKEATDIMGLSELLDKKSKKLLLYQQKLVCLARALVRKLGIFLLDEPLAGLNGEPREQIINEIIKLHSLLPVTFICATTNQAEAQNFGGRVVEIT